MVSFTPYTKPVSPGQTYLPLSDEVLLMGAKSAYDQKDKIAQKIGSTYNSLFGISTYGKDAEVLSQFQQDFENQVGELSKANLRDPEITSKINSLITQYSSNPDVLNIYKRASVYANELKRKQEAEEKGKGYYSGKLRKAEKYYNSGNYLLNESFSGISGISPEIHKLQSELIDKNPSIKRKITVQGADGRNYVMNKVDGEKAAQEWKNIVLTDPSLSAYYQDLFEQNYEDANWDLEGQNILNQAAQTSYELANSTDDPKLKQYYLEKAQKQQNLANDNRYTGQQLKKLAFENFINEDAQQFGDSYNVLDLEDIKTDQITLENLRISNDKWLYGEKLRMDAGYYEDKGIPAKQESSNKTVYSITGEPVSAGALYNSLKAAFEGKEVGMNYLAPKIAKSQNIDYDPKRMKLVKNSDGTLSLQEAKVINRGKSNEKIEWKDVPNTKTDLNSAIGLFSGADKKSYDQFVNQLNKQNLTTPQLQAKQWLISQGIANPTQEQIDSTISQASK